MKDPAFPMYAQDFLMGTLCMSFEDIGRYAKLLCYQWDKGYIPKKNLGILVGLDWVDFGEDLRNKFVETETEIFNERLENEREKRRIFKEKQLINGRKGGRPRAVNPEPELITVEKPKPKPKRNPKITLLEDENENENKDILNGKWKFDFTEIDEPFRPILDDWLTYKKERKQTYKSQRTFLIMYSELQTLSGGDPAMAAAIVRQSIANNYAGLFKLKNGDNERTFTKAEQAKRAAYENTISLAQRLADEKRAP